MKYNGFYIHQTSIDYYEIYYGDYRNRDLYITGVDSFRDACMMVNFYKQTRSVLGW